MEERWQLEGARSALYGGGGVQIFHLNESRCSALLSNEWGQALSCENIGFGTSTLGVNPCLKTQKRTTFNAITITLILETCTTLLIKMSNCIPFHNYHKMNATVLVTTLWNTPCIILENDFFFIQGSCFAPTFIFMNWPFFLIYM